MDVDKSIDYTQWILRVTSIKKYKQDLAGFKESKKGLDGYQWELGPTRNKTIEKLWTWAKSDANDGFGDMYLGCDWCTEFDKEIWLDFGKRIWRKHRRTFQEHTKYIHNDIVKPFRVGILHYTELFCEMHDLANYLPPPPKKGGEYDQEYWTVWDK